MNYMKKLFTFLMMLIIGIGSTWATLSSNTIAKSGVVTDTWNITSALPTDDWTAMGENTPAGVSALGSYTAYSRTQNLTLSNEGALFITYQYSSGTDRLDILGVDLLDGDDNVVGSDYHHGYTGTYREHNVYIIDHIASGDYKIRFIINSGVSNSKGDITVKHVNIKTASSFADISQWYFVRMHSNQTHYMYYKNDASTKIAFDGSRNNNAHYLWGFVKDTDGIKIYNKAAGSSVAIDNNTPCTLSESGQTFSIWDSGVGSQGAASGAYFALYKNNTSGSKSYLNYQSGNINRWSNNDAGSTFMIDEATFDSPFVEASEGKIYKIQAYFSDSDKDNLYFTNNNGTLAFNYSASNGVKDYWILRPSGNSTYPWRFESGRGDGNFLSSTNGLSTPGVYLQINTYNNNYFDLRGSNSGDASTSSIVNLGTWHTTSKTGFGAYGDGGCWSSTGHNTSGTWTTEYTIEEVTGVSIYTVVSNINAGGVTKTSYTGKAEQTNGGFYILSSTPSASDFTAISVTDYTAGDIVVDEGAKTITVNYTATITYTLTDVNGATYSWSASGTYGTAPTISGCYGSTLSNEVWSEESRTYTADITFPFPISSNSVTNWCYINIFDAKQNYTISDGHWFYWHADDYKVIAHDKDEPTNETGKIDEYKWAMIPAINNGAITFTIKNAVANKYIYHYADETYSSHTGIRLGDTGVAVTYVKDASANKYYLYIPSVSKYISANSVNGDTNQRVGAYGSVHDGESVAFYEPTDFATLESNLVSACEAYTSFKNTHTIGSGLGEYSGNTYEAMETALNKAMVGSSVYTAAELTADIATLENPGTKLTINQPTAGFYRFHIGDKYMCSDANNSNVRTTTETNNDASTIFYLDENNYLIAYSDGYGFNFGYCRATTPGIFNGFDFSESATIGYYNIHSNAGTGDATWSDRDITIDTDDNILTEGQGTWTIEPVESLPLTLAANSYTSFSAPVAITIPDNCKAYIAKTKNNNTIKMEEVTGNIPANTGIIIGTEADANPTFTVYNGSDFANCDGNILASNVAASALSRTDNYFFGKQISTGNYIFTKLSGTGDNYTLYGHKAYLPQANIPDSGSEARIAVIWDDDPTGLNELKDDSMEVKDGKYYQNQKIVVIRNGVKYNVAGQIIK